MLPTIKEYENAYRNWYLVTAKEPVLFEQYMSMMSRLPKDIMQINEWLNEGRKPNI